MAALPKSLEAWGTPDFGAVLKAELSSLGNALPLQAGLAAGSYALAEPFATMVIHSRETDAAIQAKVGIFYESLTPGCACAGDPTIESEQNEHVTVLVSIDRKTAEAEFLLLEE